MDFSADVQIMAIIHTYLQPFELAVISGIHTVATCNNAAEHGSTAYVQKYKCLYHDFYDPLRIAAQYGWPDVIKILMVNHQYLQSTIYTAIKYGQIETIKFLISNVKIPNLNIGLYNAANYGQLAAITLFANLGATDFNWAMQAAVRNKHLDAVKLLIKLGATNYDSAFSCARSIGEAEAIEMVKFIQFWRTKKVLPIGGR